MDTAFQNVGVFLFVGLMLVFGVAMFVFYVQMLINAAKTEQWGWFVVMIVMGWVSLLYYFAAHVSEETIARRRRRRRRPESELQEEVAELRAEVGRLRADRS